MFNDPLVWKQPCASEKDVDNLPVLKYAIIDKLKGNLRGQDIYQVQNERSYIKLDGPKDRPICIKTFHFHLFRLVGNSCLNVWRNC